ncbi:AbrB/MazE/SpoVT family DNA-binding domain-containing protein [Candidatus Pacearchaeota archaeon]|nr:AbrB/MazE/SpoVT family DNA-binding domain-containing protein [Candidatus Pacearchaeota archaeon]
MEKISTKVKKWGNSFGVVIPKNIVNTEQLKEGSDITIIVQSENKTTAGDIFRLAKKLNLTKPKKTTKELLDEVDKELWDED